MPTREERREQAIASIKQKRLSQVCKHIAISLRLATAFSTIALYYLLSSWLSIVELPSLPASLLDVPPSDLVTRSLCTLTAAYALTSWAQTSCLYFVLQGKRSSYVTEELPAGTIKGRGDRRRIWILSLGLRLLSTLAAGILYHLASDRLGIIPPWDLHNISTYTPSTIAPTLVTVFILYTLISALQMKVIEAIPLEPTDRVCAWLDRAEGKTPLSTTRRGQKGEIDGKRG